MSCLSSSSAHLPPALEQPARASLACSQGLMSEAMDQPAGSPAKPRPGEGGDGATEPGTCQELLRRLRELEVGHPGVRVAGPTRGPRSLDGLF